MYRSVYVWLCVLMSCECVHMHAFLVECVPVCVCSCACRSVGVGASVSLPCAQSCVGVYVPVCVCGSVEVCVNVCACMCVSVYVHVMLVSECVRAVCLHLEIPCRGDQGHFLSQVQPLASQAASFWLPHLLPSNRALVGGGVCEELWGPGRPTCPSSQPSKRMSLGGRFLSMGSHQSPPSSLTPQAPTPRSVGLQHGPWEGPET